MIVLKGATVWQGGEDFRTLDVVVEDERIAELREGVATPSGADVLDCSGAVVAPGFVDLHVHLREPGSGDDETIATGSAAAALGGYTAVCAMPNTDPPADSAAVVEMIHRRGREVGLVDVHPIGAITAGRAGERLAAMGEMHRSSARVRLFSDDGDPVPTAHLMRRAMEYARTFDAVLIEHAEDPSMRGGHMHEGEVSALLGLPGIPAEAEEICILRDLALLKLTGSRLHIAHLSTSQGAAAVRAAKAAGLPVTCEVTPHHLALTDDALRGFDPAFKVAPPLRSSEHVKALKEAVADGTVDAIATDHAPHAPHRKDREFDHAPCGMLGLETALGVAVAELVEPGICGLGRVLELMSTGPARILGDDAQGRTPAPGAPANLTVLDPTSVWTVDPAALASASRNTPFAGRKLVGRVVHTMLRGRLTVRDGEVTR